ncbi:hypothetical protein ACJ41O_006465 [Fusarium nematophilum]
MVEVKLVDGGATAEPGEDVMPSEEVKSANLGVDRQGSQQSLKLVPKPEEPTSENYQEDSVAPSVNPKLGKRLDLVAQVLEQELEELREEHATDIAPNLSRQIELIRKLAKESRQEQDSKPDGKGKEEDESEDDDADELSCEVKRFSMEDWQKQKGEETSVLTAYYRSLPTDTITHSKGTSGSNKERQERPQRVVIASDPLNYELEDITGVTIQNNAPTMLAPPFKILTKYSAQIAQRVTLLQDQLAQMEDRSTEVAEPSQAEQASSGSEGMAPTRNSTGDEASPSLGSDTSASSEMSKRNSPSPEPAKKEDKPGKKRKELGKRLNQLRLLDDFVKTELAPYLDLQDSIKDGTLEKVSFEDLWFLFSPGDILYFKNRGHDQLCTAYSVTGGQQRKWTPTGDQTARSHPFYDNPGVKLDSTMMIKLGRGTWSPLTVDHYIMEFDGHLIGPLDGREQIKHYAGERMITDLPIYPLKFHKNKDEVVKKLVARGQKYISCYGHKSYSGSTSPLNRRESPEELHGDVFVDVKDYYRSMGHPDHLKPKLGVLQRTNRDTTETEEHMSGFTSYFCDHEVEQKASEDFMLSHHPELEPIESELFVQSDNLLQLFPHRVPAYVFRTRWYVQVDIDKVAEIDKSDEARDSSFEDLVIPESHRNLLIGLVKNQMTDSKARPGPGPSDDPTTQIDIVRGKGRGLIILLHGPPGSGKTSTAETLAAYTRRPLYPITCGDLGTGPSEVENALTEHTERAQRWGCILLLDEADVFLSRRDWRDTNHNALVSVFLRQLEYYSGILFLTTNRVGVLDEAFKSRIHVSLAYPTIQLQATIDIWEGILNRIERDNKKATVKVKFDRNALLSFAKSHYRNHEKSGTAWNGRQIRNAFQLAIALGHHERDQKLAAAGLAADEAAKSGEKKWMTVRLTKDNFRNIAKTARDFEDYLHAVRGHDSEIAKHMSLRYDDRIEDALDTPSAGTYHTLCNAT